MTFTPNEIAYLTSQPPGRLATVGPGDRPHLVPVGVFPDTEDHTAVVGGRSGIDTGAFELVAGDVA